MISWYRTSLGKEEVDKLSESLYREKISQGTVTEEFEKQLAAKVGAKYAVVTTSGSVALLMSLIASGVKAGDEVIVPNRTWVSTAHAPLLLGAKVKLVDVLEDKPLIDVSRLEQSITSRTKAIIPVHLNGRACDMTTINRVAKVHGLAVIEDACQAFLSRNENGSLGTQSDYGCLSLGVTKLITTGQGGVILTSSQENYERLKLIRNNGTTSVHTPAYQTLGFNFKFTDLLASIGIVQLSKADECVKRVGLVYDRYTSAIQDLKFIKTLPVNTSRGEVPLYMEALCENREPLLKYLQAHEIDVRPFLPDLDLTPHISQAGDFPNSRRFAKDGLFLPCGPSQSFENVDKVIDLLHQYGGQVA